MNKDTIYKNYQKLSETKFDDQPRGIAIDDDDVQHFLSEINSPEMKALTDQAFKDDEEIMAKINKPVFLEEINTYTQTEKPKAVRKPRKPKEPKAK